jgi:hypothetical protein
MYVAESIMYGECAIIRDEHQRQGDHTRTLVKAAKQKKNKELQQK